MTQLKISKEQARLFLLERQGLLSPPGWAGKAGAQAAVAHLGYVQIDSISVIARSHDLTLWSRVEGYRPEDLQALLWQERQLMEGQAPLLILPASDFPYVWTRFRTPSERLTAELRELEPVVAEVLERVRTEGALSSRHFDNRARVPGGFSTQKDALKAMELLWYHGELVTSHRAPDFTRYFDLPDRIYPGAEPAPAEDAAHFWARKSLEVLGLATLSQWNARLRFWWRGSVSGLAERLIQSKEALPVRIEGVKSEYYIPAAWADRLGRQEEAANRLTFLAPLDNLIWDRKRLLELFDFDYRWEVYTPAAKRRWGYYTLPILYGARFVGRLDPKIDRRESRLRLQGFWLEEAPELVSDAAFQTALAHRLQDFAQFHGATEVTAPDMAPTWLREVTEHVTAQLKA